jgi:hypothetical protein
VGDVEDCSNTYRDWMICAPHFRTNAIVNVIGCINKLIRRSGIVNLTYSTRNTIGTEKETLNRKGTGSQISWTRTIRSKIKDYHNLISEIPRTCLNEPISIHEDAHRRSIRRYDDHLAKANHGPERNPIRINRFVRSSPRRCSESQYGHKGQKELAHSFTPRCGLRDRVYGLGVDQPRDDFAQIMDELDFAKVKLARLPTRIEILKLSLGCLVAVLVAFWPPRDFFGRCLPRCGPSTLLSRR